MTHFTPRYFYSYQRHKGFTCVSFFDLRHLSDFMFHPTHIQKQNLVHPYLIYVFGTSHAFCVLFSFCFATGQRRREIAQYATCANQIYIYIYMFCSPISNDDGASLSNGLNAEVKIPASLPTTTTHHRLASMTTMTSPERFRLRWISYVVWWSSPTRYR